MTTRLLTPVALGLLGILCTVAIFVVLFGGFAHEPGTPARTLSQAQENIIYNAPIKDAQGKPVIVDDVVQEYQIARTDKYHIVYQKTYDTYRIAILAQPFEEVRREAEQEFLRFLNADSNITCRLQVKIVVPAYVDPLLAGEEFSLSAC